MSTANSSGSKEVVTAALLVIGSKILSGRTKDQNIGYIAEYLTAVGIDLKEVRVVGDEEKAIVDALNALRHRCTYVFTTGGIGPTHANITADCVAKAFGVPIDTDPRALAILHEWVKTTGAEMSETRLRMTRINPLDLEFDQAEWANPVEPGIAIWRRALDRRRQLNEAYREWLCWWRPRASLLGWMALLRDRRQKMG